MLRGSAEIVAVCAPGTVFDVSHKRETYGKGGSYNLFAGKDASKALGKSSLKEEDASPDYSDLPEADLKVLNDWFDFFTCVPPPKPLARNFLMCWLPGNDTTLWAKL